MNLDSARSRIKIIEGLGARIMRFIESQDDPALGVPFNDADTILRQCRFLALDLKDEEPAKDYNGALGAHRHE